MDHNKNTRTGIFFGALILFWAMVLMKVTITSLPYNPLSGGKMDRSNFSILIPQGWAFFTKSPRETEVLLYEKKGARYQLATQPNASIINVFGASRRSRIQGIEMGALIQQVSDLKWYDCAESLESCSGMLDSLKAVSVLNGAYRPTLCGEFFFVSKKPVPWAWGSSFARISMPSQTIKINSVCID